MGSMGDTFCLQSCDAGCPSGYTCSGSEIYSIDGAQAYQCVPQSGSCLMPTGACEDDMYEENDSRSAASANPALDADLYDMTACPSTTSTGRTDDDWYKLVVASDSRVGLEISGDGASDLDLHLYRSDGTVISASTSYSSDEALSHCLKAATYYIKVNGYGSARSDYYLQYDRTDETCDTSCTDDVNEDDDTFSTAQSAYSGFASDAGTETICTNDDDWYSITLYDGETLAIDLTFTQDSNSEDLDLHLYDSPSHDLWPCSPDDVLSCQTAHGQSADANEHAEFTVPSGTCTSGCDYYVVVRGWDGSTNSYDITLAVQ